jgi:cobalt-precorrin 5A hydrolase/precorrin-3B C17-methyltransferase
MGAAAVTARGPDAARPAAAVVTGTGFAGHVVVGAGCSRGCEADELLALIDDALASAGASRAVVRALATVDARADEPGLREAARRRGWPLRTHPASALRAVEVPTPSPVVDAHVGTPSVAEAAALLTAGAAELLVTKRRSAQATCAVAAVERP